MRLVRDTTRKDARLAGQPRAGRPRFERGFTIIELLIVIGIVMVLLSIIIVAVNAAMRSSQAANTQALMASINKGLVQFRNDIGYLPPVLAGEAKGAGKALPASRNYAPPPDPPATGKSAKSYIEDDIQHWFSITTLPEYLIGYGNAREVGAGRVPPGMPHYDLNAEDPPLGIRHPGPDGYWTQALQTDGTDGKAGTLENRREFLDTDGGARLRQGRIHGPYIELRDDRLLGAVEPDAQPNARGEYQVYFPGDALPAGTSWDDMHRVIVDYWGQPIRYFRKPYMQGNPHHEFRQGLGRRVPTLSDVFVLRPFRLPSTGVIDTDLDAGDLTPSSPTTAPDTSTTMTLNGASFGLLSAGPDRRLDWQYRADAEEYNRDNIVEIGR